MNSHHIQGPLPTRHQRGKKSVWSSPQQSSSSNVRSPETYSLLEYTLQWKLSYLWSALFRIVYLKPYGTCASPTWLLQFKFHQPQPALQIVGDCGHLLQQLLKNHRSPIDSPALDSVHWSSSPELVIGIPPPRTHTQAIAAGRSAWKTHAVLLSYSPASLV